MWFLKFYYSLLLLWFLTITTCTACSITETTQFEDYIGILDQTDIVADKIRILQAVWGEIQAEYSLEHAENLLNIIYDRLLQQDFGNLITKSQRQEIRKLHAQVRAVVIDGNSQLLALTTFDSEFAVNVKEKFDYDVHTRRKIFTNAIDLRYGLTDAAKIALEFYVLNFFYVDREFVLDMELYIYWKLQCNRDIDEKLQLLAGYFISEARTWNLTAVEQRRVKQAMAALPTSVQHLYWTPNICVLNAAVEEYLYEPLDILVDSSRSFIFTWHRNKNSVGSNGAWNAEIFPDIVFSQENVDDIDHIDVEDAIMTVKLTNALKQQALYRDDELEYNIMAADKNFENTNQNVQKNWRLVLHDNRIIFKQDDGVRLCIVDSLHDESRRFVQALKVDDDDDDRCAWYINECPH